MSKILANQGKFAEKIPKLAIELKSEMSDNMMKRLIVLSERVGSIDDADDLTRLLQLFEHECVVMSGLNR